MGAQNAELVHEWALKIGEAIRMQPQRPSTLLVLINPFGGARRARAVWRRTASPIFNSAGELRDLLCFISRGCRALMDSVMTGRKEGIMHIMWLGSSSSGIRGVGGRHASS